MSRDDLPGDGPLPQLAWPTGGAWTRLVMLRALDGGVAGADKHSRSISHTTDRALLGRTREYADAILVGAGTMRLEPYGPPSVSPETEARRTERGQARAPRLVIVSRSLDLPWAEPALTDPRKDVRPVIVTGRGHPSDVITRATRQAEVLQAADLSAAGILSAVHGLGLRHVSLEGGPTLVRGFLAADLVDEMVLTLAPYAATWHPRGPEDAGTPPPSPTRFELAEMSAEDSYLYARYLRAPDQTRSQA